MKPIYHNLDFGITCIDTQHMRDDFVAAYLKTTLKFAGITGHLRKYWAFRIWEKGVFFH
jgi:hypothetical protein